MIFTSRAREAVRRLALVAGVAAAAWLAWLTDLRPYVTVAPSPPARESHPPRDQPAREGALLSSPAPPVVPQLVSVSGNEWREVFSRVAQSFAQNHPVATWEHRITSAELRRARKDNARRAGMTDRDLARERQSEERVHERYGVDVRFRGSFGVLYFWLDEPPFAALRQQLPAPGAYTLALDADRTRTLAVQASPAHELVAFFDVNPLPERFVHPWRRTALWVLGLAVAVFALVPRVKPGPDQVTYRRWRILTGDLASVVLFGAFFALPLAVVGGSLEALVHAPFFTLPAWGLASLGLLAFSWTSAMAVYALTVRVDGFRIDTLFRVESIRWGDIVHVEGARLRPPRWLVVSSLVAALLGSTSSARVGQLGRGLMLAGSGVDGLRVVLKDGTARFVWVSDQMGRMAAERLGLLLRGFEAHGIERRDGVYGVRAVFPPTRQEGLT